jgi:hypothetical protein
VGNAVVVGDPMAGGWTLSVAYGNPGLPAPTIGFTISVSYVAPLAVEGLESSATYDEPITVAPGDSATITATMTVPGDARPGDTITGTLDFYTVGNQIETAGGDHLGSVPVTITVK